MRIRTKLVGLRMCSYGGNLWVQSWTLGFVWRACVFLDQLIVWPWKCTLSSLDLLGVFCCQYESACFFLKMFNLLKPIGYVMHQQFNIQQLYVLPTLYLCFVFIWEQTATCATYSINWLVFITAMKSVYSAVRTGSLNKAVCASSLKG